MSKIVIKSPTRVDLAGGTLDLWPLYNFVGGAQTVNVAIDIWTTAELEFFKNSNEVEIESLDLNFKQSFSGLNTMLSDPDPRLKLFQSILEYWQPTQGFKLKTHSESPMGGGLGGSSSLTISIMKAFSALMNRQIPIHQLVNIAHNIEAQVLNTPTGTQDYYPAASGGLNVLTYSSEGIEHDVFSVGGSILEKHFMLVFTGKSHHSGINNFEVMTRAVQKDPVVIGALQDLKKIAAETVQICSEGRFENLPGIFRAEFDARVRLAKAFSSPEIEKLHEVTLQAGAEAVKICGAGGGGCVLVWVPPSKRQNVEDACVKNGFKVLPAKPVPPLVSDL